MPDKLEYPADVRSFAEREGIMPYLRVAITLILECFVVDGAIEPEMMHDLEADGKWIVLNVCVAGLQEDIRAAYKLYVKRWVQACPAAQRDKISVVYYYRQ